MAGIGRGEVACKRRSKTVRVFISSTFRDMYAERDHLVKAVFPKRRERCAGRQIHPANVDLRRGVCEADAERAG